MPPTSWIRIGASPPPGGETIQAEYRRETQSSATWLAELRPALEPVFGAPLYPGSFNLHADQPVALPDPARFASAARVWLIVPAVISETAVGVVARTRDSDPSAFLEVFAPWRLDQLLDVAPGDRLSVRLLGGRYLGLAA